MVDIVLSVAAGACIYAVILWVASWWSERRVKGEPGELSVPVVTISIEAVELFSKPSTFEGVVGVGTVFKKVSEEQATSLAGQALAVAMERALSELNRNGVKVTWANVFHYFYSVEALRMGNDK